MTRHFFCRRLPGVSFVYVRHQERLSRLAAERLETFFRLLGADRRELETLLFDAKEGAKFAQAIRKVLAFRRQALKNEYESLLGGFSSRFSPESEHLSTNLAATRALATTSKRIAMPDRTLLRGSSAPPLPPIRRNSWSCNT
jgi:uncharacterized membrane protein YccC